MLNKQICKRCINKYRYPWYDKDDIRWEKGFILCPYDKEFYKTDINKNPPTNCPYQLEHIINA